MADTKTDHRAFLKSLTAEDRAALLRKSNRKGVFHLVSHWGATAVLIFAAQAQGPFWWALLLPLGVLLIFNFTLAHEATHKTPFENERLNELVGHIAGAIVFVPFLWFRAFHLAHHRHTNDPAHDPEIKDAKRPEGWAAYLFHLSGIGVWRAQVTGTIQRAFGHMDGSYVATGARKRLQVESIIHVCFYILTGLYSVFVSTNLLIYWILPIILGQPFLRLYLLAEHGRCP